MLQKAVEKWKAYFSNFYDESVDYVLLLEDYKEVIFLHGSDKEFFTLQCYQEELGKDFKRITLFLCTLTDFKMLEGGITADVQESEEQLWDMSCDLPDVCYIPVDPPKTNRMAIKIRTWKRSTWSQLNFK